MFAVFSFKSNWYLIIHLFDNFHVKIWNLTLVYFPICMQEWNESPMFEYDTDCVHFLLNYYSFNRMANISFRSSIHQQKAKKLHHHFKAFMKMYSVLTCSYTVAFCVSCFSCVQCLTKEHWNLSLEMQQQNPTTNIECIRNS